MNKNLEKKISRFVCKNYRFIAKQKTEKREGTNILVMSCQAIGDTITRIPFLRELRKNYPQSYITLVCTARTHNLIELCPYVDDIVVYNPELKKKKIISTRFLDRMYKSYKFGRELVQHRTYEMAIILSAINHEEYEVWIPFFAGAKRIIGYTEKVDMLRHKIIDGTYDMYLTDVLQATLDNHEVENNLEILRYLKCRIENDKYEMWISDSDRKKADCLLDNISSNKIKIVVNLSAACREREWPIENYIDVCKNLNEKYDIQYILVGAGKMARIYGEAYCNAIPNVCDLIDKTSIRET